ncbi:hypothetical protein GUITHDRAFT_165783 [Guillardia theta CCMP2712]|uniref:Choline/carnitine acyltransferase domain-containing protein n=1 Tax=Guillardia theta (strain CCMP2712) TaxID=905079 RepID=L1IJ68_GUITC|nr:hypothetical protein GUITHDRAFT_165783 [Guillardia theta CCMP2712]EKX36283.1 hypothetical protein GUITHDRAFT_165783 [Guillardia theta CCMP2712]|eukprot:XP_005823263.1 hypothetical protein GUITHDRAFT_165783 [Guillardia theta CCMP2712]
MPMAWRGLSRGSRLGLACTSLVASVILVTSYLSPGRLLMRFLLRHRAWLYKEHGKIGGLKTSSSIQLRQRLYLGCVWILWKWIAFERWLRGRRPRSLYAVQDTLPPLPVPKLRDTCHRFLDSVRPLMSSADWESSAQVVLQFASAGGVGEKMQRALVKRARALEGISSWLEEWWEKEHFLRCRLPLPVYGNWYGLDRPDSPSCSQSWRASWLVSGAIRFMRHLNREKLEPLQIMGYVPLCMWQYRRVFFTCRVPREGCDELFTFLPTRSAHIVILIKGQMYKMNVFHDDGIALTVQELQENIKAIIEDCKQLQPHEQEPPVGILTSEERDTWARLRLKLFEVDPENERSMTIIETAMFVLVLEGAYATSLSEQARMTFIGDGRNRWFDKSFQLIVYEDGSAGVNVERSWADAPVASHLFGFMHDHENAAFNFSVPHDDCATNSAERQGGAKKVKTIRLKWKLSSDIAEAIDKASIKYEELVSKTDLHVLNMRYFGKGFIKKCEMSPDAFVQMALQLAYYRLHGCITLSTETAHTRQFFHGRTEVVRTVSSDSVAFVKSMAHLDRSAAETKLHLLRRACVTQVERVKDAMNGNGVDKHLFGLKMMAKELGVSCAELEDEAFTLPVKLWTSQAPAQRGPSGGFGPVAEDGYAVSYLVNEDNIYFHVCYRRGESSAVEELEEESPASSQAFAAAIEKALLEMSVLCTKKAQTAQTNSVSTLDWTNC